MEILKTMLTDDHKKMMARMDAWLTDMKNTRKEKMACLEETEAHLEVEKPASEEVNLRWQTKKSHWKTA
jgi:hypothetical protein